MEKFTRMDNETLERLIDAYGLNSLCENIAGICHEKADHIRSSYNDNVTADAWDTASTNMNLASEFVFSHSMTIRKGEETRERKSLYETWNEYEQIDPYGINEERKKHP